MQMGACVPRRLTRLKIAKVNQTGELARFKWGVGRLILDCKQPPLVLPFYHSGMVDIKPADRIFPRIGKSLTLR
jgi:monolysocardiolipin acyltransferase